jgi:ubiquinone/menaquinone biosynthesis C-methylase UbiE
MAVQKSKHMHLLNLNPFIFPILQSELLRPWLPLVPQGISLSHLGAVLDVGCGLHQWGKDLFHAMKQADKESVNEVRIDGIEWHHAVLSHAQNHLPASASRGQIQVHLADMYHLPETFYQRYDLVQVRFLAPYVSPSNWPTLLDRLVRAIRPGGYMVWIEPELPTPVPEVPAWNQWLSWTEQAVEDLGGSPGICSQMGALFNSVGPWEHVESNVTNIPLGFPPLVQGRVNEEQVATLRQLLEALSPMLRITEVASFEQVNSTLWHVLDAFAKRQIQSTWTWHTIYGKKPSATSATETALSVSTNFQATRGGWYGRHCQ